jgi:dihydropteroate synthase
VDDGADIAVVAADPAAVRRVRAERPRAAIAVAPATAAQAEACVRAGADLIVGDAFAEVAAATGAALACSAPERAAGVRPDGLLVTATDLAGTERLADAGLAVLTDEPAQAVMAVHAWLGARVFRTRDVHGTRQVLDMVASIRGSRAPAVARRGLA